MKSFGKVLEKFYSREICFCFFYGLSIASKLNKLIFLFFQLNKFYFKRRNVRCWTTNHLAASREMIVVRFLLCRHLLTRIVKRNKKILSLILLDWIRIRQQNFLKRYNFELVVWKSFRKFWRVLFPRNFFKRYDFEKKIVDSFEKVLEKFWKSFTPAKFVFCFFTVWVSHHYWS